MTASVPLGHGVTVETQDNNDSWQPNITCLVISRDATRLYIADSENNSIKAMSLSPVTTKPWLPVLWKEEKLVKFSQLATLKLDVQPSCAALCNDDATLAVTSFYENVITLIDVKDKCVVKAKLKTERRYWGIAANSDDTALVVSSKFGPTTVIDLLDFSGQFIRTVISDETLTNLRSPDHLCVHQGHVLVSDVFTDTLHRVDLTAGQVVDTLKHNKLRSPLQVCTDVAGNVIVASRSGQCVLVRSVGGDWRVLVTGEEHGEDECVYPMAVCLSDTALIVTWYGGGRSVVKYYNLSKE